MRRGLFGLLVVCCALATEAKPKRASSPPPKGSSFEERLAVAKSVKTISDILGVTLGMTLPEAHAKLDPLGAPEHPSKESKAERGEIKAVWQIASGQFACVYVKAGEDREIDQITGFVRPGVEIPFEKIGEIAKAPLLSDRAVVWDVIRPDQPQMRIAAEGNERKASLVRLMVVKRSAL